MTLIADVAAPEIDYKALSPLMAVLGGSVAVLMVGLLRSRYAREVLVPWLTAVSLLAAIGLSVWIWEPGDTAPIIEGALAVDTLALGTSVLIYIAGLVAVLLSLRAVAVQEAGHGEYFALLLGSIAGMVVLVQAESLISLFVGLELLSIPLYVLCATELRRRTSLEAGLKYLVIGSVGSATLLYGLAMIYGATAAVDFPAIQAAIGESVDANDPLLLTGIALTVTGLAFKASVAPFHQWTPDVYQGAPTPVTAFMAVATKAAAFAVLLRLFDHALGLAQLEWGPALAALATVSIIVGNVGAIAQRSLKRMLAWSSIGQAGYLLAGVVVGSELGLRATAFYLAAYLTMNLTAFAVVVARERVSEHGDDIASLESLGRAQPWLAWPMTIAMLSLAGFPTTVGFIGKFYLIDASVAGDYAWLGVVIVVGSVVSLAYYLRVVAVMWMGSYEVELPEPPHRRVRPVTGWSPEGDARAQPEVALVAVAFAAATLFFGIWPDPLFDLARDVGTSLSNLR
ncbi:MAG TPA: NADH-quinone oxidoreductase subunit N [Thermoleophilaceae bacterium]|nr:NADH-quinone oxidoreductase subunit N [Thermoleophilaceae bacterium]